MINGKVSVHLIFVIVHLLGALVTLLPTGTASKVCRLGYNALCSFAPFGTAVLLALAILHIALYRKDLAKA